MFLQASQLILFALDLSPVQEVTLGLLGSGLGFNSWARTGSFDF